MPKPRSSRSNFIGPIVDLRFVSLVDGRKILQFCRQGELWQTPHTVMAMELDDTEKAEIMEALGYGREEHENNDGV